jgi:cytochrome c peroxidase
MQTHRKKSRMRFVPARGGGEDTAAVAALADLEHVRLRRRTNRVRPLGLTCVVMVLAAAACSERDASHANASAQPPASAAASATPAQAHVAAVSREGGALMRGVGEAALYLADEDAAVVRRIPLPLDAATIAKGELAVPGRPAAVLPLQGRLLVTVRDPGMLLVFTSDGTGTLTESARVPLPDDAWGIAVTPDESIALVTSAWTHAVSAVDLATGKKLWSVDVRREPRAVIVPPSGDRAYVTHLTSASLTRIDDLGATTPRVRTVPFPAAPLRTMPHRGEAATLAYAAVLSPDGRRLFVARHALGAFGKHAWAGQATVDVLLSDESELAVPPTKHFMMWTGEFMRSNSHGFGTLDDVGVTGPGPVNRRLTFAQPRAMVYRKKTRTLLVASEGQGQLVELEALAIDPSAKPLRAYGSAKYVTTVMDERMAKVHAEPSAAPSVKDVRTSCGAPSGVALSDDEDTAWVLCRGTRELMIVPLAGYRQDAADPAAPGKLALPHDGLDEQTAYGRALFYEGDDEIMSGGIGCAACHPEGRDDGHVWHEELSWGGMHAYEMRQPSVGGDFLKGAPRQTPMLAGRVAAAGPYGWKAESATLEQRVLTGFTIHGWLGSGRWESAPEKLPRAKALVAFLRNGLVPPPRLHRPLNAEEERGRGIFHDAKTGCSGCHPASTGYTHRALVNLGIDADAKTFDTDTEPRFRTPSLAYVGGTPPYFHNGGAATLEALVDHNGDRMGDTRALSAADRAALVAFLRTL